MIKITIKGEAETKYPNLRELDGIDSQDNFADYFQKTSYSNDVKSGYMYFKFENNKLWTITEYKSTRFLTTEEIKDLSEYTQGQWSDGIGEGFEQHPCFESDEPYRQLTEEQELIYDDEPWTTDVYISPWSIGQELIIEQVEI